MSAARKFRVQVAFNNDTAVDMKDPGSTRSVYVTRVTATIVAHVNSKFLGFQDSSATPIVWGKHIDATAAAGVPSVVTWDFGTGGLKLTTGKKLQAISEASGFDTTKAYIFAEGYVV
jgi:hypothetical protein